MLQLIHTKKGRKKEMKNSYFISALDNYINAKANKKECYYMNTNIVNYRTLTDFIFTDMILCNNIVNYSDNWDLELGDDYDEESQENIEVYQYYIVDFDNWRLEKYKEYLEETKKESNLLLWYDYELDIYILGISHYGTSWDYVPTEIEIKQDEE
jgi:hypothetical protein